MRVTDAWYSAELHSTPAVRVGSCCRTFASFLVWKEGHMTFWGLSGRSWACSLCRLTASTLLILFSVYLFIYLFFCNMTEQKLFSTALALSWPSELFWETVLNKKEEEFRLSAGRGGRQWIFLSMIGGCVPHEAVWAKARKRPRIHHWLLIVSAWTARVWTGARNMTMALLYYVCACPLPSLLYTHITHAQMRWMTLLWLVFLSLLN